MKGRGGKIILRIVQKKKKKKKYYDLADSLKNYYILIFHLSLFLIHYFVTIFD